MSSRMEKYNSSGTKTRTNKNEKLYDKVGDITINYDLIDVDNAVELNPSTNNKSSREDYQKQRELNKILPHPDNSRKIVSEEITPKEDRIYDINEILKVAKDEEKVNSNEKSKRLINTEYNILTKLDIKDLDKDNYRKEDLRSLIDDIYKKEEPKKMKNFKRKSEKELLDDLLEDNDDDATDLKEELTLKEELSKDILDKNKDEEGTVPITEEIKDLANQEEKPDNEEIPESYHKEEDEEEMFLFDDLKDKKAKKKNKKNKEKRKIEELEATIKEEKIKEDGTDYDNIDKDGRGLLIAIIVVVILIILTVLFFLYEYFFGI